MIFISFIKDTSADISKTVFGKVFFMWQSMLIFSFRGYTLRKNFKKLGNWRQIYEQKSSTFYTSNNVPKGGLMGLYDEIFLSRPWNFYFKRKVLKYFRKRNVSWNIIQFVHTIKFHSYDHDNVSFIERINNFHFSCQRYYSFKCLKILKKRSQLCC